MAFNDGNRSPIETIDYAAVLTAAHEFEDNDERVQPHDSRHELIIAMDSSLYEPGDPAYNQLRDDYIGNVCWLGYRAFERSTRMLGEQHAGEPDLPDELTIARRVAGTVAWHEAIRRFQMMAHQLEDRLPNIDNEVFAVYDSRSERAAALAQQNIDVVTLFNRLSDLSEKGVLRVLRDGLSDTMRQQLLGEQLFMNLVTRFSE